MAQSAPALRASYLGRVVGGHPRLFTGVAVAVLAFFLTPHAWLTATRLLVAWNAGTLVYLTFNLLLMARATPETMRWRARISDEGRFAILILVSLAGIASVGAIIAELASTKDLQGAEKGLRLGLAGLTIVSSWAVIHFTFALHYAHEFFDGPGPGEGDRSPLKGGVDFPGTDEPDYWDFLYFSFIIGVAAQTADVAITSKTIRRTSLGHSFLSFFFNSAILALTINIAAGLI